jgi:hypothetical protein
VGHFSSWIQIWIPNADPDPLNPNPIPIRNNDKILYTLLTFTISPIFKYFRKFVKNSLLYLGIVLDGVCEYPEWAGVELLLLLGVSLLGGHIDLRHSDAESEVCVEKQRIPLQ